MGGRGGSSGIGSGGSSGFDVTRNGETTRYYFSSKKRTALLSGWDWRRTAAYSNEHVSK